MKDEIEKILNRLERIDHKEYSCAFEFADSGTFDEMCRCFEERKKMANYINTLQKENERLKIYMKRSEDRLIEIENNYGFILDDVIYLLKRGTDKD